MFERLKIERSRLGFTQEEFANAISISRVSQGNYEKGKRTPDINYLKSFADLGGDIIYILTGERNENMLSSEEKVIIEKIRSMPAEERIQLMASILAYQTDTKNDRTIINQQSSNNNGTIIGVGTTKKQ